MYGWSSRIVRTACVLLMLCPSMVGAGGGQYGPPDGVFDEFAQGALVSWRFVPAPNGGVERYLVNGDAVEGSTYLYTLWSDTGDPDGYYGAFTRSLLEDSESNESFVMPADPWLNIWIRNVDNPSLDRYSLVVHLREDLDGDGELSPVEDAFRWKEPVDLDEVPLGVWTLWSAPLDEFDVLQNAGDGTFNGNLDELTVQIDNVQGDPGTVVEVDFDFFVFTSGGPLF